MSVQDLADLKSINNEARPTAAQDPSVWGDYFLTHVTPSMGADSSVSKEIEGIKQEVRELLKECAASGKCTVQTLRLIDAIQRLGVAYHFEGEIEAALEDMHRHVPKDDNLYDVALWFRLLRQHGIRASSYVFEKFTDVDGKFKASLTDDMPGVLSLYEAAHMAIRGEDILDEALEVSTTILKSSLPCLSPPLANQAKHALRWPHHHTTARVAARFFFDLYEEDDSHNRALLRFAKLDFNAVQQLHQQELHDMTKWWKNLDIPTKLPYARDRLVECYFWMMQLYFEPQYSMGRIILTRLIATLSLLDDTYDNYGIMGELEALTHAIYRWDKKAIDELPVYMKIVYRTLLEDFSDFNDMVREEGRLYGVQYTKESVVKDMVGCYYDETIWREKGLVPKVAEYIDVAGPSAGLLTLTMASYIGLGEVGTEEAFKWIASNPKIIKAMNTAGRLMDDLVSREFERQRKHIPSAVECYMKERKVPKEEAVELVKSDIRSAWKDMNEECLRPLPASKPLLERVVNFIRAEACMYKDGDGYTHGSLVKDTIALVLKDPVPI